MARSQQHKLPTAEPEPKLHAARQGSNLGVDGFSFFLNVTSAVSLVFTNKLVMDPVKGYGFVFEALTFSAIAAVSVSSLNLSLMVNTVGFYQVTKLLVIPFVCMVEMLWLRKQFSVPVLISMFIVVLGVGIVTVTDVTIHFIGLVIALISVVSSGLQQILVGKLQKDTGLTPNQLLSNTAPMQGMMLFIAGPFIDNAITNQWVQLYPYTMPAINAIMLSCAIAILVNVSQFICLGRFSAVTFQVLGHLKTILVLMVGWLYFKDVMTPRKGLGICLAVLGMVLYGIFIGKAQVPPPAMDKLLLEVKVERVDSGDLRKRADSGPGASQGIASTKHLV